MRQSGRHVQRIRPTRSCVGVTSHTALRHLARLARDGRIATEGDNRTYRPADAVEQALKQNSTRSAARMVPRLAKKVVGVVGLYLLRRSMQATWRLWEKWFPLRKNSDDNSSKEH